MLEIGKLQRMATRYSEMVREHAYLVGLMSLAAREGDSNLQARTKKRLAETELECNECLLALQILQGELFSAAAAEVGDELVAVSETREYATA
jgi:hypothetical protein